MKASVSHNNHWARTAVIYHIYPLSFMDASNDGKGDLEGIIQKLDYLNDGTEKSLGVDAIWLSPIYESPMADFGYDISDHAKIDPVFGSFEMFDRLVAELDRRGMKLLMDFVPNHTSNLHSWFLESRSSRTNPQRDWYIWRDPKPDGSPPNNWLSYFGGPAWTFDPDTKQYYLHSFLPEQPDLNWRNPEVQDALVHILRFWLKRGVDGFRTDAIEHLIKDDQFRDDPPNPDYAPGKDSPYRALLHTYSRRRPELPEKINDLCEVIGEHTDTFMVSETHMGIDLRALKNLYGACANRLHAPLNFNFISLPWNAKLYKQFIDDFELSLGPDDIPNYVLGNHDRPRVASRIGELRGRTAALLTFTLRGMTFIYYGDELGMVNGEIPQEKIQDPYEKNVPGFGLGRDPVRTPMQWNEGPYAGFSKTEPWLPLSERYEKLNVDAETRDPHSTLNMYKKIIWFRKKSRALLKGSYKPFPLLGEKNVFSFIRMFGDERVLVLVNFSENTYHVSIPWEQNGIGLSRPEKGKIIVTSYCDKHDEEIRLLDIPIRGHEGMMIKI